MRQAADYHTEYSFPLVKIRAHRFRKKKNQILCRELDEIDIIENPQTGRMNEGAKSCTDHRLPHSELDQICDSVGN